VPFGSAHDLIPADFQIFADLTASQRYMLDVVFMEQNRHTNKNSVYYKFFTVLGVVHALLEIVSVPERRTSLSWQ
jgi:hypothetical protein